MAKQVACPVCNDVGMLVYIWTTCEGWLQPNNPVLQYHRFIVPCGRCSLPAYSSWLIRSQHMLAALHGRLIHREAYVAGQD